MLHETAAPDRRASEPKRRRTSSHRAQSNHRDTPTICPVCLVATKRGQESRRHILSLHLPDSICCPRPDCRWHGSREDTLYNHIEASTECGAKPESPDQYEIYDRKLVLNWLLVHSAPFETVEKWALGLIEEKARELGKVGVWEPLSEWRKPTPQVLVENLEAFQSANSHNIV